MKKFLFPVLLLSIAAIVWANPFVGPISGGGGGSGTATAITDNLIVNADVNSAAAIDGSKLADNTIDTPKIKLNGGSGGYSLFLDQTNRINFAHYDNTGTRVTRIDSYDDGEIYLESEPAGPYISIGAGGTDNLALSANEITITGWDYTLSSTELSYLDNVTGAIQGQLDLLAPLISPSFTTPTLGVASATTLNTGQGAYELYAMDQNVRTTDNVIFGTVTAGEFVSSAADGTHKGNVANSGAASNLTTAGDFAYNLTTGALTIYDNVIADNVILAAAIKTFSFGIDNVVDGDDILLWKLARAITITQVDCYASTDNVVGVLQECASDNVTSCTDVDDTDWTVTNAVTGFSVNSGFENAGIAAGAWLKWVTTSEGTSNSNKLSCTVRYRE